MIRPGRAHGGRTVGLAAVVMAFLILAAVAVVSAGAAHHHGSPGAATATINAVDDHEQGSAWTPIPGKRLRPVAGVTVQGTVPAVLYAAPRPAPGLAVPAPEDGAVCASIEVLRI